MRYNVSRSPKEGTTWNKDSDGLHPEQKFAMLQDIETCPTVKEGLDKYQLCHSVYQKWKGQFALGVRTSLRNSKSLKAPDLRRLETENKKLKAVYKLKKEMNWDTSLRPIPIWLNCCKKYFTHSDCPSHS